MDKKSLFKESLLKDLNTIIKTHGSRGHWDYDEYMHGMYNGMETMLSIVESRESKFKCAPKKYGYQKKEERRIKKLKDAK